MKKQKIISIVVLIGFLLTGSLMISKAICPSGTSQSRASAVIVFGNVYTSCPGQGTLWCCLPEEPCPDK